MRRALWTMAIFCGLCGVGATAITPKTQPDIDKSVGMSLDDDLAYAVYALWLAHEDLKVAHDDLVWAHGELLAFADKDDRPGPPKGKGKEAEKGKGKEDDKKKPPHAGPDKKAGGPPHKKAEEHAKPKEPPRHEPPPHEQMLAEIRAIRELIEPGKKPHDKKDADKHDGPPHEQVLRELRELRKAVEKHHGKK